MMRMVCECVRFAPLSAGVDLKLRATLHAVRVSDDQTGASPDDSGPTPICAASHLHHCLPQQLSEPVGAGRYSSRRAELSPIRGRL